MQLILDYINLCNGNEIITIRMTNSNINGIYTVTTTNYERFIMYMGFVYTYLFYIMIKISWVSLNIELN